MDNDKKREIIGYLLDDKEIWYEMLFDVKIGDIDYYDVDIDLSEFMKELYDKIDFDIEVKVKPYLKKE